MVIRPPSKLLRCCWHLKVFSCIYRSGMPIISIEDAVAESDFDIIIVGGGTSGLLVAVRIAESKRNFNVLVLEAGISHENDPLVDVPGFSFQSDTTSPDTFAQG
ncbi:choline dehydrogenase [Moniliophthora roreri]|nr:choline dehydrogenase [Moniliophthora roreri]